jgi:hypothetical protein
MALKLGDRGRFEAEKAYFEAEAANRGPTFLPYYMSFLEMADGNVEKGVALTEEAMSLGTGFNIRAWRMCSPTRRTRSSFGRKDKAGRIGFGRGGSFFRGGPPAGCRP